MADNFDSYVPEMVATRRKFHARPELGWTEFETTATVITRLRALGYQVLCGTQVVKPEAVLGRDEKLVAAAIERAKSARSEEHTSELQSRSDLVCRLLLAKKKKATHARKARK